MSLVNILIYYFCIKIVQQFKNDVKENPDKHKKKNEIPENFIDISDV
jgi:hypothetical protein